MVIDASGSNSSVSEHWKESGFLEKLESLGGELAILDTDSGDWPGDLNVITGLVHLSAGPGDIIVRVEASQLFFDAGIAAAGLARFREHGGDYFTQWEHCRLPVGVGIRAYSADIVTASEARTFDDLQAFCFANRETLSFLYDDAAHVSFQDSLLDSRLVSGEGITEWNLNGFLDLASGRQEFRYQGEGKAPIVDGRGMPAAYGFESAACAEFPTYIMFDMTNKCNATCIHCPHSVGFPGSDNPQFIDGSIFRNVIDQCAGKDIDFIRVTADGEPLLHPHIWELFDYARDRKVGPTGLTSNGSALTKANAQRLLDSKIFMVDFSLDAFSEDTFELVRTGLSYARTHENVLRLIDMRNEAGSDLKIMVSFVNQKENGHELEPFREYWEPLVDKVLVREMHSNVGVNDNSDAATGKDAGRYPCPHLFRRTVADYAGDLKFCPIDWQGGSKLAKIDDVSITKTWHSKEYHGHRMQHLNNQFSTDSICATCEDWKSTPWDLGYEKIIGELSGDNDEKHRSAS